MADMGRSLCSLEEAENSIEEVLKLKLSGYDYSVVEPSSTRVAVLSKIIK